MSHRRILGRVTGKGLLHSSVVIEFEGPFTFDEGTRVAVFEIAEAEDGGVPDDSRPGR